MKILGLISTPYGVGELVKINFAYGVKVRFLRSGRTEWFTFAEVWQ
jgi:hypothetical protein